MNASPTTTLKVNRALAALMSAILLGHSLAGFAGLSQSAAYDVFHLVAGLIGLACVVARGGRFAPHFNFAFGAIDAYQAVAYILGIFPTQLFNLTPFDTAAHVLIAVVLMGASIWHFTRSRRAQSDGDA